MATAPRQGPPARRFRRARSTDGTVMPADSAELALATRSARGSGRRWRCVTPAVAAVGIVSPRASGSRSTFTASLAGPLRDPVMRQLQLEG
jgi:hypothetical protein